MDTDPVLQRITIEGPLSPEAIQRIIDAVGPLAVQSGATVGVEQVNPNPLAEQSSSTNEIIQPLTDTEGVELNPSYYEYLPTSLSGEETEPVVSLRIIKDHLSGKPSSGSGTSVQADKLWMSVTRAIQPGDPLSIYVVFHKDRGTVGVKTILVGFRPERFSDFVKKLQADIIDVPRVAAGSIKLLADVRDNLYSTEVER